MSSWELWVNLAALGVFVLAIGAGIFLLIRAIPHIAGPSRPVCAKCGADAREMDAFICSNCKCDVRESLLAAPKPRRAVALIRHVGILTLLLAMSGAATWKYVDARLPWSSHWVFQHGELVLFTSPPIRWISVHHVGQQLSAGHLDGVIYAEAHLMDENLVRLEITGPGTQWRIVDAQGKASAQDDHFTATVIQKFMIACGVAPVEGWELAPSKVLPAQRTRPSYELWSANQLERDLTNEINFMIENAGHLMPRRTKGYTWTDSASAKSAWAVPILIASWSIVWLALVAWQTRASVRAATKEGRR